MRNQFNVDAFNRSVDFRKQVQAGAITQRNIGTAVDFGMKFLTAKPEGGESILDVGIGGLFSLFGGGDDDSGSTDDGFGLVDFGLGAGPATEEGLLTNILEYFI